MKCAVHPDVETNLRCGKCDKPICPKCMVQTPVGARCRECAKLYKLPTYRMSIQYYLRAIGTGLGMAAVTGVIWGLLGNIIPFIFLNLLIGAAVGYVIAEVIHLAVNRKRGIPLAVIAGIAVGLSYLVAIIVPWGLYFSFFDMLSLAAGIAVAVTRIK
ncbi:MAG: hypothetical protein JW967_05340 [Dehalococcoidales bacterium]|nr:hypothetical protein [Dehalococcoidales bacterium]